MLEGLGTHDLVRILLAQCHVWGSTGKYIAQTMKCKSINFDACESQPTYACKLQRVLMEIHDAVIAKIRCLQQIQDAAMKTLETNLWFVQGAKTVPPGKLQ